jgi:hypothetical protein
MLLGESSVGSGSGSGGGRTCLLPALTELDLSHLAPGVRSAEQEQEVLRVQRWTEQQRATRRADRAAIRAHALANGLPLPPPADDDDEGNDGVAAAAAFSSSAMSASTSATTVADVALCSPLGATLAALPCLRVVNVRGAARWGDGDMREWASAATLASGSPAAAFLSASMSLPSASSSSSSSSMQPQPQTQQEPQLRLTRVDVSECSRVSTAGVRALLDVIVGQARNDGGAQGAVDRANISSTSGSDSSIAPFQLLAIECPDVQVAQLPLAHQTFVQASGAFEF